MENDRIGRARLGAMLQAQSEGRTSNPELEQAAKRAENRITERTGHQSEKRFVEFASKSPIVKLVSSASALSDVYEGIDRWVQLVDGFRLPPLPVQIKSSFRGVELFMHGDPSQNKRPNYSFEKLHGLILVINSGPSTNLGLFNSQMRKEIGRVVRILDKNPDFMKDLANITPNRLKNNTQS